MSEFAWSKCPQCGLTHRHEGALPTTVIYCVSCNYEFCPSDHETTKKAWVDEWKKRNGLYHEKPKPEPGKLVSLGGYRLEDLHSYLDEAISDGATGAVLIVSTGEDNLWSAFSCGDLSPAERAFIYQQLILLEVAEQGGV